MNCQLCGKDTTHYSRTTDTIIDEGIQVDTIHVYVCENNHRFYELAEQPEIIPTPEILK